MPMDLRSLRYFLQVAEAGSLTGAATLLHVAQPSLTRHMQKLEEELGTALFVRATRGVTLTEAGLLLRDSAERVLRELERVRGEVRAQESVPRGTVALGLLPTLCPVLLPGLIPLLRSRFPAVELDLRPGGSMVLPEWLLEGRVDVAVTAQLGRDRSIDAEPLAREEMVLLQAPGAARTGPVGERELAGTPLVMTAANRAITDALLAPHGLALDVEMVLNSLPAIRLMVQNGSCRTVLPYGVVHRHGMDGLVTARRLLPRGLHRQLVLAFPAGRRIPAAVQAVAGLLRASVADVDRQGGLSLLPSGKRIASIG